MKRSKKSSRAMRHQNNTQAGIAKGNSRYAKKVKAGDQMYGPGCCAHGVSQAKIDATKQAVATQRRREGLV